MSAQKLQQQSLKPGTDSALVRCLDNGVPVGHAFATRWDAEEKKVCWVTQLCVRKAYRRRGIATAVSTLIFCKTKRTIACLSVDTRDPSDLYAMARPPYCIFVLPRLSRQRFRQKWIRTPAD
jgi:GNAT superfamily N-acetyltransferase